MAASLCALVFDFFLSDGGGGGGGGGGAPSLDDAAVALLGGDDGGGGGGGGACRSLGGAGFLEDGGVRVGVDAPVDAFRRGGGGECRSTSESESSDESSDEDDDDDDDDDALLLSSLSAAELPSLTRSRAVRGADGAAVRGLFSDTDDSEVPGACTGGGGGGGEPGTLSTRFRGLVCGGARGDALEDVLRFGEVVAVSRPDDARVARAGGVTVTFRFVGRRTTSELPLASEPDASLSLLSRFFAPVRPPPPRLRLRDARADADLAPDGDERVGFARPVARAAVRDKGGAFPRVLSSLLSDASLDPLLSESLLSVHSLFALVFDSARLSALELLPPPPPPPPPSPSLSRLSSLASIMVSAPRFSATAHICWKSASSVSAYCEIIISVPLNARQLRHTRSTSSLNASHFCGDANDSKRHSPVDHHRTTALLRFPRTLVSFGK